MQKNNLDWNEIDKEKSHNIMNECVENVMTEYENEALDSSARNLFLQGQVREIAGKTVDVLIRHIRAGKFIPSEYELRVAHGQIDRVDLLEKDGKIYVKVIDYKSGNKKFSITDTMLGRQMQLMVYLKDAVDYEKKLNPQKEVAPGAGLYFHVHDPYVSKPDFEQLKVQYRKENPNADLTEGELEKYIAEEQQYKDFRMTGMVNADAEIPEMMDENIFEKVGSSDILPVNTTKSGIGSSSTVMDEKTYEKFIHFVCKKAEEMQEEILNGKIDINPIEGNCSYCPYHTVCGFDRKLGDKYREVEKISLQDVKNQLEEES